MPPWLMLVFARLSLGERVRKGTSGEYRIAFGDFFFLPVFLIVGVTVGRTFFDRAGVVAVWAVLTFVGVLYLFGLIIWWAKAVPAAVSAGLGVVAWSTFAWLSWH